MRKALLSLVLLGISSGLFAQKGSVEAYSRDNLLSKLETSIVYSLPEFVEGHVYYKDASVTVSTLNVCAFDNSVRFLAGKDTLKLRSIDNVDCILTPDNKFVRRDGMVLNLLRESESCSLGERKRLKLSEPKMDGGYGAIPASSSARVASNDDHSSTDSHSYGYLVSVDYLVSYDYYLVMPDGSVVQAKKAAFVAAFPVLKDKINSIIKLRKLKLARKEDVLYLYDYCLHELNQH